MKDHACNQERFGICQEDQSIAQWLGYWVSTAWYDGSAAFWIHPPGVAMEASHEGSRWGHMPVTPDHCAAYVWYQGDCWLTYTAQSWSGSYGFNKEYDWVWTCHDTCLLDQNQWDWHGAHLDGCPWEGCRVWCHNGHSGDHECIQCGRSTSKKVKTCWYAEEQSITYQLICQHEDSFESKCMIARTKEVFERWPKKVHNHGLVTPFSAEPKHAGDAHCRTQIFIDLPLMTKLRTFRVNGLHLHHNGFPRNHIICIVYIPYRWLRLFSMELAQ